MMINGNYTKVETWDRKVLPMHAETNAAVRVQAGMVEYTQRHGNKHARPIMIFWYTMIVRLDER